MKYKRCPNCKRKLNYIPPKYPEQNDKGLYECKRCGLEISEEGLARLEATDDTRT